MHWHPVTRPVPQTRAATHAPKHALARLGAAAALWLACSAGPVVAESASPSCDRPDLAAAALGRINQLRAAGADCRSVGTFGPAGALAWSPRLAHAAERHSQDMVAKNFFAHTGSDGSTPAARIGATGYAWRRIGENVAADLADIDGVLAGWMSRDGHCANLMDPGFTEVGLVCVPGTAATEHRNYWTLDLARSR
jgi:uncharacterized protein YkwD